MLTSTLTVENMVSANKAGLLDAIRRGKYDQPLSGGAMRDWEVITAF